MTVPEIDTWTKRIVSLAAPDIRAAVGSHHLDPDLVNEVCLQVQQIVARSRPSWSAEAQRHPGLVEEMAMAIYVTVAASDTPRGVAPSLLITLNASLGRALRLGEIDSLSTTSVHEAKGDEK